MTESIIEGIRVEINAVSVTFKSVAFTANVSIQQVSVFSAKGDWTQSQDLRETRAKERISQFEKILHFCKR